MNRKLIGITVGCLLSLRALGAEQSSFSAWLHASDHSPASRQTTNNCRTIFQTAATNLAHIAVAPDNRRYAILFRSPAVQFVEIRQMGSEQLVSVYSNTVPRENNFSPLGVLWTPDGDRLFVKYGYADIGNGKWFPHDARTGKVVRNEDDLLRLESTPASGRTDPLCQDDFEPVWTAEGREFESEHAARKAGYTALLPSRNYGAHAESLAHVKWEDGKEYRLLADYEGNQCLAHVLSGGSLIETVTLAAPIHQGVLFRNVDGHLIAKVLPRDRGILNVGISVDLGSKKLERITDLGENGLLLQSTDTGSRYWQVLDVTNMAGAGRTGVGPSQGATGGTSRQATNNP